MKLHIELKIIAILLICLTIVPFLMPLAYFPINKFFSEFFSILTALTVFIIFTMRAREIKFSSAAVACFLFSIFAIIQPIFVEITLFSINFYLFLLFITLGLFSIAITSISNDNTSRKFLLEMICWGLLISGVLQSLIGYIQFLGHEADFHLQSSYNDGTGSNIFGNLGQRNQYIDLLSTCAVAVIYLLYQNKIKMLLAVTTISIYNIAITLCAGRTVFVYFIFSLIICVIMLLVYKNNLERFPKYKKVTMLILGYIGLLIATELIIPVILTLFHTQSDIPTGIKRLSSEYVGQSTYRRFYEWYKALIIFTKHPIMGIGWFQYPKEAIYMMLDKAFYYIPANKRLYTHCHNSILNILAETGIIGTLITIGYGIIYSFYKILKNCDDGLIILVLCSPILMHSFFEYPLWYTYFLVLLVMFISFAKPIYSINNFSIIYKLASIFIAIVLIVISFQSLSQAFNVLRLATVPEDADTKVSNIQQLEAVITTKYDLLNYSALLALDAYMPQNLYSIQLLQQDIKFIDLLGSIAPFPSEIYKQMIIYHMLGDENQALYYANLLTHSYPALQQEFIAQMSSCTNCAGLVSSISSFAYEDRSPFARWFDAIHHKQSY
jgi:O-antigen ligase